MTKGKLSGRIVMTLVYSYWLPHNTLRHIYLRNGALSLLENSANIIAWLLSTPGSRCPYSRGNGFKNCEISLAIASYAAEFFDRMKNCIERVKLSFGFAVMVFVFAGSVFTARYLRLNKGTCRPSYLPCPLFMQVHHMCPKSQCRKPLEIEQGPTNDHENQRSHN